MEVIPEGSRSRAADDTELRAGSMDDTVEGEQEATSKPAGASMDENRGR